MTAWAFRYKPLDTLLDTQISQLSAMGSRRSLLASTLLAVILSATAAPNPDAANNRCPQGPNPPPLIYAHPDCTMYYQCAHGLNFPMHCPGGLHFSSKTGRCEFIGSPDDTCGTDSSGTGTGQDQGDSNTTQNPNPDPNPPAQSGPEPNPYEALNRCPPAGPVDVPFYYSDPTDCSRFFSCSHGRNFRTDCRPGQNFNNEMETCIVAGSENDTCETGLIINQCRAGHEGVIPHPFVCQRYFDCSQPETPRDPNAPPPLFLPFEKECPYREVFDVSTGQCQLSRDATCSGNSQPRKDVCDYLQLHCEPYPLNLCKKCDVYPSCEGLPDGYHDHPYRPNIGLYIRCNDGYYVFDNIFCEDQIGRDGSSLDLRRCVGAPNSA